jgi:glycosyltransferase involved in cell wall biosynthesis
MISFVVPAYNEEFELPATLAAIHDAARSTPNGYEIIVVDDGSTDSTAAVAEQSGARVVPIHRRQIAAARNAGARAAVGDTLLFVDADTRISGCHVVEVLEALRCGCVGGGARLEMDGALPRWAQISLPVFCWAYFASNLAAGAFLFARRDIFEAGGGFDEAFFAGEEVYFSIALKKLGPFKILDHPVTTSGRKVRMHSAARVLSQFIFVLIAGKWALRRRGRLQLWYDGKREARVL